MQVVWSAHYFFSSRMRITIFTTPVLSPMLRWLSRHTLRLLGWTLTGAMPTNTPKSVVIAAPHTSNWDFPYTLMVAFAMNLNIQWMGKQQLFRFPFRHLMLWLGGIAVNRSQSTNLVEASVQTLQNAQRDLHLVVPPEGTPKLPARSAGGASMVLGAHELCPRRRLCAQAVHHGLRRRWLRTTMAPRPRLGT